MHVITLSDLIITLKQSGPLWYFNVLLLFLFLHFIIWVLRLIKSMVELVDFMMKQFLQGVLLNMLFDHMLPWKLILVVNALNFFLSTNKMNILTYPVFVISFIPTYFENKESPIICYSTIDLL